MEDTHQLFYTFDLRLINNHCILYNLTRNFCLFILKGFFLLNGNKSSRGT